MKFIASIVAAALCSFGIGLVIGQAYLPHHAAACHSSALVCAVQK